MTPMAGEYSDVFSLELDKDSRIPNADAPALVQALRRALMSLARGDTGQIERLFSGHEADGRPDSSPSHGHVYVVADGGGLHQDINRLIVAAPWAVSRLINPSRKERRNFGEVVRRLEILRAGKLGRFHIHAASLDDGDPLLGPSLTWKNTTPYSATRNLRKKDDPDTCVTQDVFLECRRRGLPAPRAIVVEKVTSGPRGGNVVALFTLQFATAVRGPIILGRDSHQGGGLFHAVFDPS